MNVAVSVGSDVEACEGVAGTVSVGSGVNVSGTDVAEIVPVGKTLVDDDSISGEGEAGVLPPDRLHARVVRTTSKGSNILFIS